jgi:hypothetical protein
MASKITDNNKYLYEKDYCCVHSYGTLVPFYIKQVRLELEGL